MKGRKEGECKERIKEGKAKGQVDVAHFGERKGKEGQVTVVQWW